MKFLAKMIVLAMVMTLAPQAATYANLDCQNFTTEYDQALTLYLQNTANDEQERRKLEKLKRRADKQLRICIKSINRDFKNTIRQLKITFPRVPDSRELNLSNKSRKDEGIAAASLERDRRIQALPKIQSLPFQN